MERDRHVIAWSCEFGLACLLLVGCDKLADLDELDPPPRRPAPAATSSRARTATTPSCVGHDEDGDGTDACDTCPIDNAIGDGDGDTDGIGDVRSASGHRHRQRRVLHAVSESRQLSR